MSSSPHFLHRAKSGADIATIATQIDAALAEAGGRIDVLTISADGNDVGKHGIGGLIYSCIELSSPYPVSVAFGNSWRVPPHSFEAGQCVIFSVDSKPRDRVPAWQTS